MPVGVCVPLPPPASRPPACVAVGWTPDPSSRTPPAARSRGEGRAPPSRKRAAQRGAHGAPRRRGRGGGDRDGSRCGPCGSPGWALEEREICITFTHVYC